MTTRPKLSVYIGTTLDGFIAREDGSTDWMTTLAGTLGRDGQGYQDFLNLVDAFVLGRLTYQQGLPLLSKWPYAGKRVVVISNTNPVVPPELADQVAVLPVSPVDVVAELTQEGIRHVCINGGQTVQAFLRADLVDELTIMRLPVLIGRGLPLFGELTQDIHLRHQQTQSFANGFVVSRYTIGTVRSSQASNVNSPG